MKKNPTKQDIINDLWSLLSLKTFIPLSIGLTVLFLVHIRISTFAMFAASWICVFILTVTQVIVPTFKRAFQLIRRG